MSTAVFQEHILMYIVSLWLE